MCTVRKPGLLTTVQDEGRLGYRAYGMPIAGVMDHFAYTIANILAENEPRAAVLEMTLLGGTFHFATDAYVALCGADMQGRLNGRRINAWSSFHVPAGGELTFGYALKGCRSYLAITGGIDTTPVLGSRSTYTRAAIGGYKGRALQSGDELIIGGGLRIPEKEKVLSYRFFPHYDTEVFLRVVLGPQDDFFTAAGIATFFNSIYSVTRRNDRMGYMLEGPVIQHTHTADIVSDAICPGAVQIPGNGMPIVMMVDCQTTGGYPKIGTVIGPDLNKLAQAKPGDKVRFVPCSVSDAVAIAKNEHERFAEFIAKLSLYKK
jgi:antagonist of KipI